MYINAFKCVYLPTRQLDSVRHGLYKIRQSAPLDHSGSTIFRRSCRQLSTAADSGSQQRDLRHDSTLGIVEKTSQDDGYTGSEPVMDIYTAIEQHNGRDKNLLQQLLPVEGMRDALITVHDWTGLSWSSTIAVGTLLLKIGFIPVWAMGERARRNNAHLMPIAVELQEKLKEAQKSGDVKMGMEIQRKLYSQMTRKTFIKGALIQVVAAATQGLTFAWVYGGLRMFAIEPRYCPSFVQEKSLWLQSLTLPDPYYALPAALWLLMTSVYELNRHTSEQMRKSAGGTSQAMKEQELRQQKMKYFTRGAIAIFAYMSCSMTSGTFFYLIPSFMFQAVLRYLTRDGLFARALRLPTPKLELNKEPKTMTFQRIKTHKTAERTFK